MTAIDKDIASRIAIARYVLICGIVFLHTPPYVPLAEIELDAFGFVQALTSKALFRSSVPMLTCISGYLIFKAGYDKKFSNLLSKKTKTILVPMIIWNLPLVIILYFLEKYFSVEHEFRVQLYPFDALTWFDATTGYMSMPINYPLHFLRDLFILSMMAPIFGILLRTSPYVGLFLVSVIFLANLDGPLILRDTMVINLYIGGMAAVLSWDLKSTDSVSLVCTATLIAFSMLIVILRIENITWFHIFSPFLIWPIISGIQATWVGKIFTNLSGSSFAIFVSHGPSLLVLWIAFNMMGQPWPYAWFWVICPLLAIAFGHILRWGSYRAIPSFARVALGNR